LLHRKPKKSSWKLAVDDETLLECLKQQQAAGIKPVAWNVTGVTIP
jgi:hypothetical protein